MGLRSPERAVSSASCMRHVGGAPASTLRVTVTPVLRCACSISALAFITLVTSVAFLNRLRFHTFTPQMNACSSVSRRIAPRRLICSGGHDKAPPPQLTPKSETPSLSPFT
eukprot:scaffold62628_cov30-Phaeocystis_antarctica.AAC.2